MYLYYIIVHKIFICLSFKLKIPAKQKHDSIKSSGHAFKSCFWQSCDYEW
jgi:hypothetical protein